MGSSPSLHKTVPTIAQIIIIIIIKATPSTRQELYPPNYVMRSPFYLSWIILAGWTLAFCQSFLGNSGLLEVRIVHAYSFSSPSPSSCSSLDEDHRLPLTAAGCPSSLIPRRHHYRHRHAMYAIKKSDGDEPQKDLLEVSDAEALLACYAYLNRRKRLENSTWTQKEDRQRMKAATARPHFFWEEDLSHIAARLQKEMRGEMVDGDAYDYYFDDEGGEDDDEEHQETSLRPSRDSGDANVWSGEFTSFPTDPSPTHTRRSQSAKRTWADSDFRERWYENRWGHHQNQKEEDREMIEEKELEQKVRALPSGFLGSTELSTMTEDEIEDAIQIYYYSKKKQIESRKKTLADRKAVLEKQMEELTTIANDDDDDATSSRGVEQPKASLSRDSLFAPDEAALKKAQRKRSERAKKLYQKRLENSSSNSPPINEAPPSSAKKSSSSSSTTSKRKYQPNRATPQDAMLRIQRDLDSGTLPAVEDIQIIMEPGKLGKRRNVLRQILSDFFNLRGKCVPIRQDANQAGDDAIAMDFATKCVIDDLGALVIDLMKTRQKSNNKTRRK